MPRTFLQRARDGLAGVLVLSLLAEVSAIARGTEDPSPAVAFRSLLQAREAGSEPARNAALAAFTRLPPGATRLLLEPLAAPGAPLDEGRAALDVLGRIGVPGDVALVVRFQRDELQHELEGTILSIASRDPRALNALDELLLGIPTGARAAAVRAVERLGTPLAAGWLGRCVERAPDVRGEALARLGRLVQDLNRPAPDEAYAAVRGVLAGAESESLSDAIIAAGRMEDADAIPHLFAILRTGTPGTRADAAWALERITTLRFGDQVQRWDTWYATEQAWWRDESETAFTALVDGDRAERITALLAIGRLHGWRHKLAREVAQVLQDPNPEVARLAAQVLGRLDSRYVGAALARALERPEPEVVHEAWLTLRNTTRKDLPSDPAAWRALFAQ